LVEVTDPVAETVMVALDVAEVSNAVDVTEGVLLSFDEAAAAV
jgi:hypothetical protein